MQRGELATTVLAPGPPPWSARASDLILVSNRGPIEYSVGAGGRLIASRGQGGLVSALTPLAARVGALWVAVAMGEGDRRAAALATEQGLPVLTDEGRFRQRLVVLPPRVYQQHYNVFSNPLLWFLQHKLWGLVARPGLEKAMLRAWHEGYVPANRAFAEAIVEGASGNPAPVIMLHDYHLYLAPGYLRARLPRALLHHFVHIPWPAPGYWQPLPPALRQAICTGLVANDVVGFQTQRSAHNFLRTCRSFLPGAKVDEDRGTVALWPGHHAHVRVYPISVDVAGLRRMAASLEVRAYRDLLASRCGEHTIVRVDRLDPSKNVALGFRAFDLLLRRHPELEGRVKFIAFLVPSRTAIPEYQRYTQETFGLVAAINSAYGRNGWKPVELFYENNYAQAIAGLQVYDALLVNSLADGMNLVAKEGPIVNRRDGTLVLSQEAGAHEQLHVGAVSIPPADVESTAAALALALNLPPTERKWRVDRLRSAIEQYDLHDWVDRQIEDLQSLAADGR